MRYILVVVFLFTLAISAQEKAIITLKDSVKIEVEDVYGADAFNTLYFSTANHTFHKQTKDTITTYTNFQLGKITSANTFNPLKLLLFYKDFNTAIVLDNRLAEIFKIDFNIIQDYKNVVLATVGYDNTMWIFNLDLQRLELYDYKQDIIRVRTVPIQAKVLDLKSNYNFCYLLTEDYLYTYNYFGSLINKIENTGYTSMAINTNSLVLKKDDHLHYLSKNNELISEIESADLLINQFFVTDESLYIYNHPWLKIYQLKIE